MDIKPRYLTLYTRRAGYVAIWVANVDFLGGASRYTAGPLRSVENRWNVENASILSYYFAAIGARYFFNLVLQIIEAFKTFSFVFIISGGTGAPADSQLFYTVYLFNEAFKFFRMGYASSLAWILLLIIGFFTLLSFVTSKYWVYYENERD